MTTPIYRYHAVQKDKSGWRFTFSPNPMLGEGWSFDGIAFHVPKQDNPNAVPLYQFHYDQKDTYGGWRFHFSTSKKPSQQGWKCDGIAFRVFAEQQDQTVPIYQFHVAQKDGYRHHLSFGNKPSGEGWTKEGIAFYAYKG